MTEPTPLATGVIVPTPEAAARRAQSPLLQLARRRPLAFAALVYLALLVLVAVLGTVIAPYDPVSGNLAESLQGPSWAHWLGTDQLGRDTLSRLIVGTGPTLLYTGQVVAAALISGVAFGMLAGFAGGYVDTFIMAISDLLMSLPGMVMLLVVLTLFQDNMPIAMVCIGVLVSGFLMRVIRASTLSYRQETFIDAAAVAGLPTSLILGRHILTRQLGTVLVQASMLTGMALLLVTGAAYLGFGTEPPYPSWGLMIGDGAQIFGTQPMLMVSAGLAIACTVIATGLLGEGLRDLTTERWSGARARARAPRRLRRREPAMALEQVDQPVNTLLSVRGLQVAYGDADLGVVHGIDFDVAPGSTVGLLGESGSGKSATARAILGVLRNGRVTGGRVLFNGTDITGIGEFPAARRTELGIAYISQEPHMSLDPAWRVGAQLVEALRQHRPELSKVEARESALDLLEKVQMREPEEVFQKYAFELSGGMAQRVSIARALCAEPQLLIADEPTTALDVTVQAEILDLLRDIQLRTGMAILLITHDWGVVADMCSSAVVMRNGVVCEAAPIEVLFSAPADDYTASLLASNPAAMPTREQREEERR